MTVTASVGVACARRPGTCARWRSPIYDAKRAGRDRVVA